MVGGVVMVTVIVAKKLELGDTPPDRYREAGLRINNNSNDLSAPDKSSHNLAFFRYGKSST